MTEASERNKRYYERVWGKHEILDHRLWSTEPLIKGLKPRVALEVGCGNRPRIPVSGNYFLDINGKAIEKLNKAGGNVTTFDLASKFPFKDSYFDLVCSFEVLEHLENDKKILSEMVRVLAPNGTVIISFPINMKYWVEYDRRVGHVRRYQPGEGEAFFGRAGLSIVEYAKIKIPWPTRWQSPILMAVMGWLPGLISGVQKWLEQKENSVLREKLVLRKWTKDSVAELANETTALFVLKKK